MTLLEQLQAHRGGLLRLKTQLYWYSAGGYDNNPGRICLLLDTATPFTRPSRARSTGSTTAARTAAARALERPAAAFLLIDGQPHWIWVAEEDIERL